MPSVTLLLGLSVFLNLSKIISITFYLALGFFGFGYWMLIQNKLSKKANVPVEVKEAEFEGWYNEENKQIK